MHSPTSSRQSSVMDSPSLRKRRDLVSPRRSLPSSRPYLTDSLSSVRLPSTTPLKSPGQSYYNQFRAASDSPRLQDRLISTDSLEQDNHSNEENMDPMVPTPPLFKVPGFLSRPSTSIRPAQQLPSEPIIKPSSQSGFDLISPRQARQSSLKNIEKSLESHQHAQRAASIRAMKAAAPLLRTTETEYDVSPNRSTRLLSTPRSSFMGTPTKRQPRLQMSSPRPASPLDRHSASLEQARVDAQATLDWLQQTEAAKTREQDSENEHGQIDLRYIRQDSVASDSYLHHGQDEEVDNHERNPRTEDDQYEHGSVYDEVVSFRRRSSSPTSPDDRREAIEQEDNIPQTHRNQTSSFNLAILHEQESHHGSRTPIATVSAENSLLEVAETTTNITNQLRGVYTNLQEFFSPETEAKLCGVISVIDSQKSSRTDNQILTSSSKPRPLEFRSASVQKDFRKTPSRLPTQPVPFNFSERLNQLQRRHTPHLLRQSTARAKLVASRSGSQFRSDTPEQPRAAVEEPFDPPHSTPMAKSRNVNEYQEMSKSPFIALSQRKRLLEQNDLRTHSEPEYMKRPPTKPKSPMLLTRARAKPSPMPYEDRILQEVAQRGGYKANPVDRRVFESAGDMGVPKVVKPMLTEPKSPAITKRRPAPLRPAVVPKLNMAQSQAHRKFRVEIAERGLASSAESSRRLSQEKHKRQVEHRESSKAPLTIPEPFSLMTQARGDRYQDQFKSKLSRWKQIEREHQFKALPLPNYPEVFVPKKSTKPLTHTEPPVLTADRRIEERHAFDDARRHKEKMLEDMRAEKAREDELREQQELRKLRARLVPHPTPIKYYPRIEIRKSTKPLTTPRSPNIGDKRKRMDSVTPSLQGDDEEPLQRHRHHQHHHHHHHHQQQHQQHQYQHYSPKQEQDLLHHSQEDRRQELIRQEIERQREQEELLHEERELEQMNQQDQQREFKAIQSRYTQRLQQQALEHQQELELERMQREEASHKRTKTEELYGRRMGRKSWLEANDI
ncbi:MAG: hypothetical protein BYD32DRAFT_90299 [Podila humilis]|nr:MAG: hypothetical protein BYD32DRAFT_90299 [Podila humilis]